MENEKEIKYFSMFTGVGGFELGFERTTDNSKTQKRNKNIQKNLSNHSERIRKQFPECYKCIGFSENEKYCSKFLANKFPNIKNYGDATKINPDELPDFDMLCGGFPCQTFSIAGRRRGFEDTRGTLFFEIARIVKVKKPKIVFLENVKGLLNHNKGETFKVIIQTLSELGYDVQWMVLNSKFFGVPQNRERVFIIGNLRGTTRSEILPFRESNKEDYYKVTEGESFRNWKRRDNIAHTINAGYERTRLSHESYIARAILTPDREEKRQNGRRIKNEGEEMFTLTGRDIHGIVEGMKIRRLTPIECERLQGFPDNWTEGFSDTQRYKMMGNAVTVNVIEAITNKL